MSFVEGCKTGSIPGTQVGVKAEVQTKAIQLQTHNKLMTLTQTETLILI